MLIKNQSRCKNCGYCINNVACPTEHTNCISCGVCSLACPNEAIKVIHDNQKKPTVKITIENERIDVPSNITIKKVVELAGYKITKFPDEIGLYTPCETGGCYSCVVTADKRFVRACVTPVKDGMKISIHLPKSYVPIRIVHGFMGHTAGGVGTPWYLKNLGYIEVACFACGCNFRCPQCQNWTTTYCGTDKPLTPRQTAEIMIRLSERMNIDRIAISGGESTLNKPWLVRYVKELKNLNSSVRIHVDTNGSVLTKEYVDELVAVGMTDIGIDIKGLNLDTFCKITNVRTKDIAEKYLANAWNSVKYIVDNYSDDVFMGIGIPYNKDLISQKEILKIGDKICAVDDKIQVCVLDYRPEFRRQTLSRPTYSEMHKVYRLLRSTGLKLVLCQTYRGYIGP